MFDLPSDQTSATMFTTAATVRLGISFEERTRLLAEDKETFCYWLTKPWNVTKATSRP